MLGIRLLAVVLFFPVLAERAAAQAIHRVGLGFAPTIQAAIDAAAPGDVVLIDAGVYPGFAVDKSLTITAVPSALVQVVTAGTVSITLPPSGRVHLGGLDVQAGATSITGGIVSLERCTLRTVTGLRLVGCFAALRWSSALATNGSGVLVKNAHLHASDCTFSTAAGGVTGIVHGAVKIAGVCTCSLSQCNLVGAWPNTVLLPYPSVALHVAAVSAATERVWVDDCSLIGGFSPTGQLGPAVLSPASPAPAPLRLHRCAIAGAIKGAVNVGPVTGLRTSVDMQIGATFTTTMLGEPGHLLILYLALDILGPGQVPQVEQPALGLIGLEILGFALADAQGTASFPVAVPNNVALRHLPVWWRGIDLLPVLPWQATPAFVTVVQ